MPVYAVYKKHTLDSKAKKVESERMGKESYTMQTVTKIELWWLHTTIRKNRL